MFNVAITWHDKFAMVQPLLRAICRAARATGCAAWFWGFPNRR